MTCRRSVMASSKLRSTTRLATCKRKTSPTFTAPESRRKPSTTAYRFVWTFTGIRSWWVLCWTFDSSLTLKLLCLLKTFYAFFSLFTRAFLFFDAGISVSRSTMRHAVLRKFKLLYFYKMQLLAMSRHAMCCHLRTFQGTWSASFSFFEASFFSLRNFDHVTRNSIKTRLDNIC